MAGPWEKAFVEQVVRGQGRWPLLTRKGDDGHADQHQAGVFC